MHRIFLTITTLLFLFLPGCGGGGGGTSGNPGNVQIEVSPNRIDTGDRMLIRVHINSLEFFENEFVVVKVRCPSGLSYVQDSTVVQTHNASENFTAQWSSLERNVDESVYVVTTLAENNLHGATSLEVSFYMEGQYAVSSGACAADIDHSNPDEPRFDVNDPKFSSLSQMDVRVIE